MAPGSNQSVVEPASGASIGETRAGCTSPQKSELWHGATADDAHVRAVGATKEVTVDRAASDVRRDQSATLVRPQLDLQLHRREERRGRTLAADQQQGEATPRTR